MKRLLFLTFVLLSTTGFTQGIKHKVYLNTMMRETVASLAEYTLELTGIEFEIFDGVIKGRDGKIKARGGYVREAKSFIQHGYFVFFYPTGGIESEGNYDRGVKVGNWLRYAEDGTPKPDRYYDPKSAELVRSAMTGKLE